ncbi:hypothetical protein AM571_CH02694 [Rhizobium etli 8C-3]|uniref:Uncharacterized protein n=1 Tax=Rhizobium etli 8C-3 TaxID=538025 RepID=A0A1L5P5T6_RHIET|nr:hypothetical protein AM571_CH02694 [Rhizobium etli 8C-3]
MGQDVSWTPTSCISFRQGRRRARSEYRDCVHGVRRMTAGYTGASLAKKAGLKDGQRTLPARVPAYGISGLPALAH